MNNSFLDVVALMRDGRVLSDISTKLDDVVKSVIDTGGSGELTVTFKLQPTKKGMGGVVLEVSATHACKVKRPELEIGSSVFFVTAEGRLTRDDPAQESMFGPDERKEQPRG